MQNHAAQVRELAELWRFDASVLEGEIIRLSEIPLGQRRSILEYSCGRLNQKQIHRLWR